MIKPVLALLALSASVAVATPAWAQGGRTVLRVADHYPVDGNTPKYTIKFFMEAVKKATNGAVDYEYYPAEQLGKSRDMLALTQQGVAHIALVAPAYISEKMPLSAVAELPGTFSSSCEGGEAYWKLARDGIIGQREFAPNGVRAVLSFVLPPYQILTRAPIKGIAEVQGLKLRSGGAAQDITIRKLGAVPVRMAGPDVYEALSRGTLDGIVFPLQPALDFKLQTSLKTGTIGENFGGFAATYVISESFFKSLPAPVQQAMVQAGDETAKHACQMLDRDNEPAVSRLREQGVDMKELPSADRARIKELLKPVQAEWAAGLDGRGLPGTQVLQAFLAALPAR